MDASIAIQGTFILVNFIWFFVLNSFFCTRYPSYNGRFLWSLLFFPLFFILISFYNSLLWILLSLTGLAPKTEGIIYGILGFICSGSILYCFEKLRRFIFYWNEKTVKEGEKYISIIILLTVMVQLINAVFSYITIKHLFDVIYNLIGDWAIIISWIIGDFTSNTFFDSLIIITMIIGVLAFQIILDVLVYNAATHKLSALNYELRERDQFNPSNSASLSQQTSANHSSLESDLQFSQISNPLQPKGYKLNQDINFYTKNSINTQDIPKRYQEFIKKLKLSKKQKHIIVGILSVGLLILFLHTIIIKREGINSTSSNLDSNLYLQDTKIITEDKLEENTYSLSKFVDNYPVNYYIRNLGKDWIKDDHRVESGTLLYADGRLDSHQIRMVCLLEKNGYLYGRYYNENGIILDVNGYINQNNNLCIQLGHGNETSNMILTPQTSSASQNEEYLYAGEWGKSQKPVEIKFTQKDFSPVSYSLKDNEKKQWLYDADLANEFDTDGTILKSFMCTLPYGFNDDFLGFLEVPLIKLLSDQFKLNGNNVTSIINTFLSTDSNGNLLPKYKGEIPEYANFEEEILIKPLLLTDKFIQMEIFWHIGGITFMSDYSSVLFIIPLNYRPIPEGVLYGHNLVSDGHDKDILWLLNKYRPNPEYTRITSIPDNIRLTKEFIIFRFPLNELGCKADGEVEVSIPIDEMKHILQPRVYNMISSSTNWKEY